MSELRLRSYFPASIMLLFLSLLFLAGCGNSTPTLQSIALNAASTSVAAGGTVQFAAAGTYSDHSTKSLSNGTWTTSNSALATVDANGMVTSKAQGTVMITCTYGGMSGSMTLVVTAPGLAALQLSPATPSVAAGLSQVMTLTGTLTTGAAAAASDFTTCQWTSSNTAVATVTASGTVNTLTAGSSTISVTCQGITKTAVITVTAPVLASLQLSPANPSVIAGQSQAMTVTGILTNGLAAGSADFAACQWSSSNTAVATMGSGGSVNALAAGASTISVTCQGITKSAVLTVTAPVLTSLQLAPTNPSVAAGLSQPMTLSGTLSNGLTANAADFVACQWTSSNLSVATMSSGGSVDTHVEGSSTISVTCQGITKTAVLTVTPAVLDHITLDPSAPNIALGDTVQFVSFGVMTDNTRVSVSNLQWSTSDPTVATIDTNGLATTKKQGSTIIGVSNGQSGVITTLSVVPPEIKAITISPRDASIAVGATQQFTAKATMTDGTQQDITSSSVWDSFDPDIARVDSMTAGLIHGIAIGNTSITVANSTVSDSVQLSVGTQASAPNGLLYVWPYNQANIYAYGVQGDDTLVLMPVSPMTHGADPTGTDFVLDPTGKRLYSTGGNSTVPVYASNIDFTDGSLTPIAGSPFVIDNAGTIWPYNLLFDPVQPWMHLNSVHMFGIGHISSFTYDATTGALGTSPLSDYLYDFIYDFPIALAFSPNNSLLYSINRYLWQTCCYPDDYILERSAIGGSDGLLSGAGSNMGVHNLDAPLWIDPSGQHLYAGSPTQTYAADRRKLTLFQETGASQPVDTGFSVSFAGRPFAITFDPVNRILYVADSEPGTDSSLTARISSFTFDPATGMLSLIEEFTFDPALLFRDNNEFSKFQFAIAPDGKAVYFSSIKRNLTGPSNMAIQVIGVDPTTHHMSSKQEVIIPLQLIGSLYPRFLLAKPPIN